MHLPLSRSRHHVFIRCALKHICVLCCAFKPNTFISRRASRTHICSQLRYTNMCSPSIRVCVLNEYVFSIHPYVFSLHNCCRALNKNVCSPFRGKHTHTHVCIRRVLKTNMSLRRAPDNNTFFSVTCNTKHTHLIAAGFTETNNGCWVACND